jgi:polysaccharide export outer membrane protein
VLRATTRIETPSTDRLRVMAGRPGLRPELPPAENAGVNYLVGPGDKLRINVFGEPGIADLTARIDGAGYIQVPVIELVKVSGLTTRQIQSRLKRLYEKRFVAPWVTVEIAEAKSRPLYLLGEFKNPGVRYLELPTTLLEALALGGGLTGEAYLPGARLIRGGQAVLVDLKGLLREGRLEQNVPVGAKDVIFAPRRGDMKVYVLGAVTQPRAVNYGENGRTVLEALTLAQGPLAGRARLSDVRVVRSFSAVEGELIVVDVSAILKGESVDFPLEPSDVVFVPQTVIADWNDVLAQVLPSLQLIGGILTPIALIDAVAGNN